ncbi:MAG: VC0807 family protein [Acidimicrobiales bacterium]
MTTDHALLPHFEVPRFRDLARHAGPHVFEAMFIPLGIFYLSRLQWGDTAAILAALAWSWAALLVRVLRRQPVPGLLLIGIAGLTARSVIGLVTGSLFVYFLQPSLGTAAVAAVFLFSVPAGRPLAERLARDFVPFPPGYLKRPVIRRFFLQISVMWALVLLFTACSSVGLLLSQPVAMYLAAKTGVSLATIGAGVVVSVWWFKRTVHVHNRRAAARTG